MVDSNSPLAGLEHCTADQTSRSMPADSACQETSSQEIGRLGTCFPNLANKGVIKPGQPARLVLAVSGGADSMAMAWLARHWQQHSAKTVALRAVTIDHGLRASSASEAEQVAGWLAAMGIETTIRRLDAVLPQGGVQAWARNRRLDMLAAEAWPEQAMLVLAHQADDQVETLLMRLAKGSGIHGLGGIRQVAEWRGVRLLRPLLGERRALLRQFCQEKRIPFIDDPSNDDLRFERVALRRAAPALAERGFGQPAMQRLGDYAGRIAAGFDQAVAAAASRWCQFLPSGAVILHQQQLLGLPAAARKRLLGCMIEAVGGGLHPVSAAALERLDQVVINAGSMTLGRVMVEYRAAKYPRLVLTAEAASLTPPTAEKNWQFVAPGWWVWCPAGFRIGRLGSRKAAALRRSPCLPFWLQRAPARALAVLPVILPEENCLQHHEMPQPEGGVALDGGGFLPQVVIVDRHSMEPDVPAITQMYFTGFSRGLAASIMEMQGLQKENAV